MSILDDPAHRARVDPGDALAVIEASANQWRTAAESAVRLDPDGIDGVVVAGMGGSGVAGDLLAALALDQLAIPVMVHKDYGLPAWVGSRTLVVITSYSGTTEEALSAYAAAIECGAGVLVISSGGPLTANAASAGTPVAHVPGGGQPRHSLGWLVVPALVALGLDDGLDEAVTVLGEVCTEQGRDVPTDRNPAKRLGLRLADGALPVVHATGALTAAAALRLRCQLNENAKMPAHTAVLPELAHNEIVGWEADPAPVRGLVWVRDPTGEHPRTARRAELTDALLGPRTAWSTTISSRGVAPLARLASLLVQCDLASVYAAHARGVDPLPIASIDRLKSGLGKVSP